MPQRNQWRNLLGTCQWCSTMSMPYNRSEKPQACLKLTRSWRIGRDQRSLIGSTLWTYSSELDEKQWKISVRLHVEWCINIWDHVQSFSSKKFRKCRASCHLTAEEHALMTEVNVTRFPCRFLLEKSANNQRAFCHSAAPWHADTAAVKARTSGCPRNSWRSSSKRTARCHCCAFLQELMATLYLKVSGEQQRSSNASCQPYFCGIQAMPRQPLQGSHDRSPDLRLTNFGDPGENDKAGSGQDLSKSAEMSRQVSHLPHNHDTHDGTEIWKNMKKKTLLSMAKVLTTSTYVALFLICMTEPLSPSAYPTLLQSFSKLWILLDLSSCYSSIQCNLQWLIPAAVPAPNCPWRVDVGEVLRGLVPRPPVEICPWIKEPIPLGGVPIQYHIISYHLNSYHIT